MKIFILLGFVFLLTGCDISELENGRYQSYDISHFQGYPESGQIMIDSRTGQSWALRRSSKKLFWEPIGFAESN